MKKIFFSVALLITVTGIGVVVWRRVFVSEEAVIADQCRSLGEAASFRGDESLAGLAIRARKLKSLLAETCRVELKTYAVKGSLSRDEAVSRHFALKQYFSSLAIHVYDIEVLSVGETQATVQYTVRATGVGKSGQREVETIPVLSSLKKTDGRWRFEDFREKSVLDK